MVARNGLFRGTRTGPLRALLCLCAVLAVITLAPASAAATIVDHTKSTEPYDFVHWDCGYPVHVVGTTSDNVHVRADKNPDIVYVTDNYAFRETWTASDGRWFTLSGDGLAKDVKATRVSGTLYEFTFHNSGNPSTVTDSSGKVLYRDRGNLSFQIHDRPRHRRVQLPRGQGLGTPRDCRHRPVQDRRAAHRDRLGPLPDAEADRLDVIPHGLLRVPAPELQRHGREEPPARRLQRLWRERRRDPGRAANLLWTGIPRFLDIGGWPTERPLAVLALQHVEDAPGFDFSPCDGATWGGSCNMQLQHDRNHASPAFCTTPDEVHSFIAYAVAHYNVDPKRVYATGLSCGAFGTWEYLAKYGSEQVAAAVPIAGDGRPAWDTAGCGLGSVAIWAFHGELDDVVDPQGSIETMTDLQACPGVPANRSQLTVYPGLYHDGWDQAYSGSLGDDIYTWMLGFSKP